VRCVRPVGGALLEIDRRTRGWQCGRMHRAHHVGSLLRPQTLRDAWSSHRNGAMSDAELSSSQDEAVRDVVDMQQAVGLQVVTDGEFRRVSYWQRFVDAVDGLEVGKARFSFTDDAGDNLAFTAPHVVGRVARTGPICGAEIDFVRSVCSCDIKVTLPSPSTMQFWYGPISEAYESQSVFFRELAAIYRAEIADLAERGASLIQLDEVALAMLCDRMVRDRVAESGEDPEGLVDHYVEAVAAAFSGAPEHVTTAMHVCRGNYKGHWMATGGYEPVAEMVFGGARVDLLFLEFDDERAGGFEPLRFVPDTTGVVLGIVSSKSPELETRDTLLRRIEDASRFVPTARLGISPQCGFASTIGGNPVTSDDQRRKLELLVSVSHEVWGSA